MRQVTQRNTGRRTAGIDGLVALTSQARAEMAVQVHASDRLASAFPGPAGARRTRTGRATLPGQPGGAAAIHAHRPPARVSFSAITRGKNAATKCDRGSAFHESTQNCRLVLLR